MSDHAMRHERSPAKPDNGGISLRWKVLAGNLATGLLALAFAGAIAWGGFTDLRKRASAEKSLNAFEEIMKAANQIPAERAVWAPLTKPGPATADEMSAMEKAVAVTDAAVSVAKAAVVAAGLSTQAIEAAERAFLEARTTARQGMVRPNDQRPPNSYGTTIDGLGRGVDLLTTATNETLVTLSRDGGDIENLLPSVQLAQLSQTMRTVNGARSGTLGIHVRNQLLAPARISELVEQTGQVALIWQQIEQAVHSMGDAADLVTALNHVRNTLMTDGERRYRDVVAAVREGRPSPIAEAEYRAFSTPMLNNVLVLRDAALKFAHRANDLAIAQSRIRLLTALAALLFVAVVSVVAVVAVIRQVVRPLVSLTAVTLRLAHGELSVEVPDERRKDEIGAMARALHIFREALIAKKATDEAAARDAQAQIERAHRLDGITHNFEALVADIVNTVSSAATGLEESAGTLTATANRSQDLTIAVAAASEEASTNVHSVASATEELSTSVNEISRQVQTSAQIAGEAVEQVRRTTGRVAELSQAAARIGDVVELINSIASQTNLLALNATIEAARAGDAGRGFAVVASEVKALAGQTARATDEITQQISSVQAATQESVGAIKEISGTIERIAEIASTIAAAVEQQGAATQEISRNVQQAAHGTQQVSANITDVQRGAAQTGTASEQVLSSAKSLAGDSTRLKREVSNFLEAVRTA
jgi:methyl-accepting chemotaxis protein